MKKSLFLRTLIIIAATILTCTVTATVLIAGNSLQEQKTEMLSSLRLMSQVYNMTETHDYDLAKSLSTSTGGSRVMFISPDGTVIADSENPKGVAENHLGRPEITDAVSKGSGVAVRYSETLGVSQLYFAYKAGNGDIIRMSYNVDGIGTYFSRFIPSMVISAIISLIIGMLIARGLISRITRSINTLKNSLVVLKDNPDAVVEETRYDELNDIVYVFNNMREGINNTISAVKRERQRAKFILESMDEGVVLVNGNMDIVLANNSSMKLFGCENDVEYKSIFMLIRNSDIVMKTQTVVDTKEPCSITKAIGGKNVNISITPVSSKLLEGDTYINPAHAENSSRGALLVITDITNQLKAQQMRSEFFTNASHELKTPITSIMGFAELINSDMVTPEKQKQYIERIHAESRRLADLLGDILKVSKLESSSADKSDYTQVKLLETAREIVAMLMPQADKKHVSLSVSGDEATFMASSAQMHELMENLLSNAVKYNKENGSADITIKNENDTIQIIVSDTGIGIPDESKDRVFERFYRVDKSRSHSEGSTGLGLAIVKHIVKSYGGNVSLESKLGNGTKITVFLPVNQ